MSKLNKQKEANLSAKRLKELLNYSSDTGKFYWIAKSSPNSHAIKIGGEAGCLDKQGRIVIQVDGKQFKAHRLAWLYVYNVFPEGVIDHFNGNSADNRICNLRDVSNRTNMKNTRKYNRQDISLPQGILTSKNDAKEVVGYRAHWTGLDGKVQYSPTFNIKKLGGGCNALILAQDYRQIRMSELLDQGDAYTDRHGKQQ